MLCTRTQVLYFFFFFYNTCENNIKSEFFYNNSQHIGGNIVILEWNFFKNKPEIIYSFGCFTCCYTMTQGITNN